MKRKEFRITSITADESRTIHGVIPYESLSQNLGGFYERLAPGCFSKTLKESKDIRCLVEHDDKRLLARTKNGSLRFIDTDSALRFEFEAPETSEGEDILTMARSGLVNGCSFGFMCIHDSYEYIDGREIRTVLEAKLLETSIVLSEPAYESSQVYVRSLSEAFKDSKEIDENSQAAIKAEIEKLSALLPKEETKVEEVKEEVKVEEDQKVEKPKVELKVEEGPSPEDIQKMNDLMDRLNKAEEILLK